jgi:hypothetical protein
MELINKNTPNKTHMHDVINKAKVTFELPELKLMALEINPSTANTNKLNAPKACQYQAAIYLLRKKKDVTPLPLHESPD